MGFNRDQAGLNEETERVRTEIPYCDTKIEAEDLVAAFCRDRQIPYTIIRPANAARSEVEAARRSTHQRIVTLSTVSSRAGGVFLNGEHKQTAGRVHPALLP